MVHARFQIRYAVRWPASDCRRARGIRRLIPCRLPEPRLGARTDMANQAHDPGRLEPGPREPADRIDFVYAAGAARTTASAIIGEPGAPGILAATAPWPSDHRLVVSTFDVQPGAPPTLVTVDRRANT